MSIQTLTQRGDRVVRQVEQRGEHIGVHVEEIAADNVEGNECAQADDGGRVLQERDIAAFKHLKAGWRPGQGRAGVHGGT
ncbi:hypothetical protein ACIQPP_04815 [Streptomyces violaceusniger]|uniref:hypothetical protein n=1 Tax=Streptomyces violaceusniger TaxID=68280 RepID=UPI00131B91F7|nr:hypothetical protein [Streptomyces hygroscopicus]